MFWVWLLIYLAVYLALSYKRASLPVWTIAAIALLLVTSYFSGIGVFAQSLLWLVAAVIFVPLNIFPLRRWLLSKPILTIFRKHMPTISETEKQALTAGTVGWTGELFSGMPNWQKLMTMPKPKLSDEEQAFLQGPVEQLCAMIDNWKISRSMTIPDDVMKFIASRGFFGMIIPKEYGGLQFSALGHAMVISKLASKSIPVATAVSVPNSLGPAELLLHFGTTEQKEYYLPRLASGAEVPCFALTSPVAGSDASAIEDHGVLVKKREGKEEKIYMRLNWNKRYITLSPIATVIGLAFKLYDPDRVLGDKEDLGITCALIPANTQGVVTGRRHYPLDTAFPNGPTQGKDVLVPVDAVIGGAKMIGHGWRMLMDSLAAGRGISLPSISIGGAQLGTLATGAYCRARRQFNTYIGNFGGIKQSLANMAGYTYLSEATRILTINLIDQGQKPVVASAISKYHTTEFSRQVAINAMDVHGGKGICMGPSNYVADAYISSPIGITVEGANILTRSLIIFGQGSIRCHPYVLPEMTAALDRDQQRSLHKFDHLFFAHIGFLQSNAWRSLLLGLTDGMFAGSPGGDLKRYYQKFARYSAILAFCADCSMISLGGALKRREKLSARLGDLLSYLFIGTSVLKYYADGLKGEVAKEELPVVKWSCDYLLYKMQVSLDELLINLPNRFLAGFLRVFCLPLGKRYRAPRDKLTNTVANLLLNPSALRDRLAENIYATADDSNYAGQLIASLQAFIDDEPLLSKIQKATRANEISGKTFDELVNDAVSKNILSNQQGQQVKQTHQLRLKFVNVDDFGPEFFKKLAKKTKE